MAGRFLSLGGCYYNASVEARACAYFRPLLHPDDRQFKYSNLKEEADVVELCCSYIRNVVRIAQLKQNLKHLAAELQRLRHSERVKPATVERVSAIILPYVRGGTDKIGYLEACFQADEEDL